MRLSFVDDCLEIGNLSGGIHSAEFAKNDHYSSRAEPKSTCQTRQFWQPPPSPPPEP